MSTSGLLFPFYSRLASTRTMFSSTTTLLTVLLCVIFFLDSTLGWTIVKGGESRPTTQETCKVQFKDCGSPAGKLLGATYNGTCDGAVVILKKGTVAGIVFNFETNADEDTLTSKVAGELGPVDVPFPLANPNACLNSGLKCPVKANTPVNYSTGINVLSSYPSIKVFVKWQLQDKNKKDVFCVLIPAKVES